jgi:hypothetical protein
MVEKIKDTLIPAIQTSVVNVYQVSDPIHQMGIVEVYPKLDYDELRDRIARSKNRVYLSENWLALEKMTDFEEAFRQTALHKVSVRILLINPDSSAAKQRSFDLYGDETYMLHLSQNTIKTLQEYYKKYQMKNLEVKYHSLLPSVQMFLCDNLAMVGFYFHKRDSQYCPQLGILLKNENNERTEFGKRIEAEFDSMWNSAKIIQLDTNAPI